MTAVAFFLDEHIFSAVAPALKAAGIGCVTTAEAGRTGASDESHLIWCLELGLVVVTNDTDFLQLARQVTRHAGVIWFREGKYSIGSLAKRLRQLHAELSAEEMVDRLEYL